VPTRPDLIPVSWLEDGVSAAMSCDHTTHYGCLGPRWSALSGSPQDWTGECGRITSNSSGICDEHEADWKENYPNHPLKVKVRP
jgi:hypothetical protein